MDVILYYALTVSILSFTRIVVCLGVLYNYELDYRLLSTLKWKIRVDDSG